VTIPHLILRHAHTSMGLTALVAGAASMTFRKGSALHRQAGTVFFVSMLIMSGTGAFISIFITPVAANIMGGFMTFYLTLTGSFFVGQAKLFPPEVRQTGVLKIPAFLPFALLLYWLIRIRVWPQISKRRALELRSRVDVLT